MSPLPQGPTEASPEAATAPQDLVCALPDLTAAHAETLQALLCSALPALEPLRFANTQTVDLAGLQLVLAYARARSALKLEPLCAALPLPLRSALSLTGCLDAAGHLDGNLWT